MYKGKISIRILFEGEIQKIDCYLNSTIQEVINLYKKNYLDSTYDINKLIIRINGKNCDLKKEIQFYITTNKDIVFELLYNFEEKDDDIILENYREPVKMEIDIDFFKTNKNNFYINSNPDLPGLLKLCLLKKISKGLNLNYLYDLPKYIKNIIQILQNGKLDCDDAQEGILQILKKIKGSSIINFSKYVDGLINKNDINTLLIPKFNNSDRFEIFYIMNCLGKYINYERKFQQEFERAKRDSIFEFSIIAAAIIETNTDNFEMNRQNCPNRVDRVLFHGTSYDSISKILPSEFRKAIRTQHGKGVYFTEDLDSCWIYGSEKNKKVNDNHRNLNIPKVGEYFSFIASAIYYDQNGYKRVKDNRRNPNLYEINFAYAGMKKLETIKDDQPDPCKFVSTEYVVNDLAQICPFISFKLKRDEYCIIWRDINFSSKPIYNNKFDPIFKRYLKERMSFINYKSKYNIYPCETTEEALKLIRRKKYNKIILISNIGNDLGGKLFVEKAREIIRNDTIVLFNAYSINHLKWIQKFPNSLFANTQIFYEKFLNCFYENEKVDDIKNEIMDLKSEMEEYYKVKFNLNDSFLDYPSFLNDNTIKYDNLMF